VRLGLYLNRAVLGADYLLSALQVRLWDPPGYLATLFVHGLFLNKHEANSDLCYPQQRTTVEELRMAIRAFQGAGYQFVAPGEILEGLDPSQRHCLLTFDDGYYNNRRALELMETCNVPALFFVCAESVENGKAFWWDYLYRFRRSQGIAAPHVFSEISQRMRGRTDDIETEILRLTGATKFLPVGEVDRGFTPAELREFASHPKVHIGNHGYGHEFLTSYCITEAAERISKAQQVLTRIAGKAPLAIAYPYGVTSPELTSAAMEAGLRLGFTTVPRKASCRYLSDPRNRMLIGRFPLWEHPSIKAQCERMRSNLLIHCRYESLVSRVKQFRPG
jgi:peptidoglycan/xylan/chitin deacetylase (PgdA/CDA1 family)